MNKIDQLGLIKARIADLAREEKKLKDEIIAEYGYGKFDGEDYTFTVYEQERSYLDLDAVRARLSRQFIRAHTFFRRVDVIKLTARQRRAA